MSRQDGDSGTRAVFMNIETALHKLICDTKVSIRISVAWFTNKELMGALVKKLAENVAIEVIISDDVVNKRLSIGEFIGKDGKLFVMDSKRGRFLHDKFAIFDNTTIVSGSYNWTYFAEYRNHESIIVSNNKTLIDQFMAKFRSLIKQAEPFAPGIFDSVVNIAADNLEEVFSKIESELEEDFISSLKKANALGANINESKVIEFIRNYGAIGGAKRLIDWGTDRLQSGLMKLWEIRRLDLSFEAIVLQEKYKVLFPVKTLENAQKRLDELQ